MNKKEILTIAKRLCYGAKYQILDGTHERPSHIRIDGLCEVWPTTGTIKKHGSRNFIKGVKGLHELAEMLGNPIAEKQAKQIERIDALESKVAELQEMNEELADLVTTLLHDVEMLKLK